MKGLVCGVGINDSETKVKRKGIKLVHGKKVYFDEWVCPAYRSWLNMLNRCYTRTDRPTYEDCSVVQDWLLFSKFRSWHKDKAVEGFALDKDIILAGNKIYSEDTCSFVPIYVNSLFTKNKARGKWPLGVHLHKNTNKFIASCSVGEKTVNFGSYLDEVSAHKAWISAKINHIESVIQRYASEEFCDDRVISGLDDRVVLLKKHLYTGEVLKELI